MLNLLGYDCSPCLSLKKGDTYTDGRKETGVNDNAMHEEKLEDQLEQSILLATMEKLEVMLNARALPRTS